MKYIKIVIIIVIIIILAVLTLRKSNNEKIYSEITDYVNNNYQELDQLKTKVLNNEQYDLIDPVSDIKIYTNDKTKNKIIDFKYKTIGDKVYGFYYSENDFVASYQNKNYSLLEIGNSRWMWRDDNNNDCITGKIKDKWYYYKAVDKRS